MKSAGVSDAFLEEMGFVTARVRGEGPAWPFMGLEEDSSEGASGALGEAD